MFLSPWCILANETHVSVRERVDQARGVEYLNSPPSLSQTVSFMSSFVPHLVVLLFYSLGVCALFESLYVLVPFAALVDAQEHVGQPLDIPSQVEQPRLHCDCLTLWFRLNRMMSYVEWYGFAVRLVSTKRIEF